MLNFLGITMELIFGYCGNYLITILLFTILSKIILFPLSIIVQKNSIKMIKIRPDLEELKLKYCDDKDLFMEEQIKLFKKEKYKPSLGVIPLLIQIPIVVGLSRVISNPAIYMNGISPEKLVVFGLDYSKIPTLENGLLIFAIMAITTFLLCYFQNKENVLQIEESKFSKILTSVFTIVITVYFSTVVPAGVSLYWSFGNVLAIIQMYLLNFMYKPSKYIDYDKLEKIKNILVENKKRKIENSKKEKEDYKRFFKAENGEVLFYSEAKGFYKYFKPIIEYIIKNSDIKIHYITSDPNDDILKNQNNQIISYYIGENKLIPLFMKIDFDMVIMTTPDLQKYYLKRSLVRKDVEYIFTDHGLTSVNLTYREGALDYYDTIFATSKQQVDEIRAIEELRQTKPKKIIETGYCLIDEMIDKYNSLEHKENEVKTILIAPSWQEDNIMDSCLDEILNSCLDKGFRIIVRPHPQYIKRNPIQMKKIIDSYKDKINDNFIIEQDFSSNDTVYKSDIVITDWSAIGYEFSFATTKPCIFINTKIKIVNPQYDEIDVIPMDVKLRKVIGKSINKDEIGTILNIIEDLIDKQREYKQSNEKIRNEYLFNVGKTSEIAGQYVINKIKNNRKYKLEKISSREANIENK